MKPQYKIETPENIHKTLKRKSITNWVIFFVVLALLTVGIMELLRFSSN